MRKRIFIAMFTLCACYAQGSENQQAVVINDNPVVDSGTIATFESANNQAMFVSMSSADIIIIPPIVPTRPPKYPPMERLEDCF